MQNFMKLRNQSELGGRFKGVFSGGWGFGQLVDPDGSIFEGGDIVGEFFICDKEVCGSV